MGQAPREDSALHPTAAVFRFSPMLRADNGTLSVVGVTMLLSVPAFGEPIESATTEPTGSDEAPAAHGLVYARLGGGIAGLNDSITADGQPNATISGFSVAYEVAFGLSPLHGLAVALGVWGGHTPNPDLEVDRVQDGSHEDGVHLAIAGVHADYYFRPNGGFHAQAILGFGFLPGATPETDAPRGFGFGIGGGYEWALGSGLALGLLGRITYAPLSTESPTGTGQSHTVAMPALLVTASYY